MSRLDTLIVAAAICLFVSLTCYRACGQTFWDRERKTETGILIGEIALDGYQTQHCQHIPGWCEEYNRVARPFVTRGNAGQAASCALGLGAVLGTSYLFHRLGHDRLSRWTMRISIVAEGLNNANNFR